MAEIIQRYGLSVLKQLPWPEVGTICNDPTLKYAAIKDTPQDLNNVIEGLKKEIDSLGDNVLARRWARLDFLSQAGPKIERDAKLVATLGLSHRDLGNFLDYLLYLLPNVYKLGHGFQAVDYNSRTFSLTVNPLSQPITPQGIDVITGESCHPIETVCLETGHRLSLVSREGNNIVRYGLYLEDPRILALAGGFIDDSDDPVRQLTANPDSEDPVTITNTEQLDRLFNLAEQRGMVLNLGRVDVSKVRVTTGTLPIDPYELRLDRMDHLSAEIRDQLSRYELETGKQSAKQMSRENEEANRREEAGRFIEEHKALIPPNLTAMAKSLIDQIIYDRAWGTGTTTGREIDLKGFIEGLAKDPEATPSEIAKRYILAQYPPELHNLIDALCLVEQFPRPGDKESGLSVKLMPTAVKEFTVAHRGGSQEYPRYRIVEIGDKRYAVDPSNIYQLNEDGDIGIKVFP